MKQILFILFISIFLSSCVQTSSTDSPDFAGIKKGDKYWVLGICKGPEAGEIYAKSVEKSNFSSPALRELIQKGICGKLPRKVPIPIFEVVRSLIDWENDEAYLVQLAHRQTNEPIDYYTIIWPQTKFDEPVNGSHVHPHIRQYDISTHLTPVKAGEKVWIGGMCKTDEGAALTLFLSPQKDVRDELQVHVQADRCRSFGSLQRVSIAVVFTDGIDMSGDPYWLVQLANTKGEPRPWYSLAWECTLEANLQLYSGDCR